MGSKYSGYVSDKLDLSSLQVAVLMGGLGSRLGKQTANTPKPLILVNGTPFFEYEFKLLLKKGFRKFIFLVGYRAYMIEEYFGDGSRYGKDIQISYSYDGEELLGTGGAVVKALPLLEKDFMLIYADSFMDIDYFEVVYRYFEGKERGQNSLMTVMENGNRFDKSNVVFRDGELLSYNKKTPTPDMQYIDYGIEVFSKEIFQNLTQGIKIDLADIQTQLVESGTCVGCEVTHRFYEIGTSASLEEFRKYIGERFEVPHPACFIDRDGVINEIVLNENTEQLDSPMNVEEFRFCPNTMEGLKRLSTAGYLLFIVTNQPSAAKGKTTLADIYDINTYIVKKAQKENIDILEISMCPHHPTGSAGAKEKFLIRKCECRKPAAGLITSIMDKYNIDVSASYMIGDSYTDILAGKSVNLKTAFIGDYKCDVCSRLEYNRPDLISKDLLELAKKITG